MTQRSALSSGDSPDYVDALLGYLGDREPLEVFEETPAMLKAAVAGLDDKAVRRQPAPGKWSLLEIVQHLADAELTLGFRYRKVIAEDAPEIPAIDQDAWAAEMRYNEGDIEQSLADFDALRAINLRLLRRATPEQWKRHAIHNQRGRETLQHMVRLYAAHDLYHLEQIARTRDTRPEGTP